MPFLSRVWMNPLRPRTQLFLRNPYALHAAVLGGIARQPVDERVLWRLETPSQHCDAQHPGLKHRPELLVLSQSRPSWEHLIEQAGWPDAEEPQQQVRDYQPLLDRIQLGREFRFRLRANPVTSTKKVLKPSGAQAKRLQQERPRGERLAHRTASHQVAWFVQKLPQWGFALPEVDGVPAIQLVARERLSFAKSADTSRHQVVLHTAIAEGVLSITDTELARQHLLSGAGPAKAYGCGLITLAPLHARS